jgi:hypothetical protein
MGMLAKALSPPSAYSVKRDQPGLWGELVDKINGALFDAQLVELEVWLDLRPLDLPGAWVFELQSLIERQREELKAEDVSQVLLDRFDF